MQELYIVLTTGCTEFRAETLCKLKVLLDENGYEDQLIVQTEGLLINTDIPNRVELIQQAIVRAGVNLLMNAGIEVNYDLAYARPTVLHNMIKAINEQIDSWEDFEALFDIMGDDSAYSLATLIATVSGDNRPTEYMDLIVRVQERTYDNIRAFLQYRITKAADEGEIPRIPVRIVKLLQLYGTRHATNKVAEYYSQFGMDGSDADIMRHIDYEFEPEIPAPYYHSIAASIAGLIIRQCQYYSDAYELIEKYTSLLVESNGLKDAIAVSKQANDILKGLYEEVEKDEEA
jgi:hypothetical protein